MEDLDINIGMPLNMQLLVGESKRRHEVQAIGCIKGESVLVTMPRENGAPAKIYPQDEYIVRYFKGKGVIAFKTRILHVAKVPFYYLHLEYPRKLEKVEIRQAERINISIKAKTLIIGQKYGSLIRDISARGALVVIDQQVAQKGDHIELFFNLKLGEIEREVHLVCLIRNIRRVKNQTTGKTDYCYGVEFVDPSEHDVVFVQGFVYEQLLMNRKETSN